MAAARRPLWSPTPRAREDVRSSRLRREVLRARAPIHRAACFLLAIPPDRECQHVGAGEGKKVRDDLKFVQ